MIYKVFSGSIGGTLVIKNIASDIFGQKYNVFPYFFNDFFHKNFGSFEKLPKCSPISGCTFYPLTFLATAGGLMIVKVKSTW